VNRVATIADGAGHVDVYVATASGVVTGTVGDLTSDLGRIDDSIQRNVVPVAVTATTHSATAVPVAVTWELWVLATSRSDADLKAAVNAALLAFLSTRPVGGDLLPGEGVGRIYITALESTVGGAVAGTLRVAVTLPVADVDLTATQAAVYATPTGTIHQVSEGTL
jgi:hypothetical protein